MEILYFLIPVALVTLVIAVFFLSWATRNDQFEDMDTPSMNILLEDKKYRPPQTEDNSNTDKNKR